MKRLRAGDLRHRVTIRRSVEVQNDAGGYGDSWTSVAEAWAEVIGLDGREAVMSHVLQGVSVYRLRIRWRSDLLPKDEIRSGGSCFLGKPVNIRSIVDPDGRREQLVLIVDTADTLNPEA